MFNFYLLSGKTLAVYLWVSVKVPVFRPFPDAGITSFMLYDFFQKKSIDKL
ncbi:hypothetical protein HMPREF1548_01999 [Clostridium sp. KLE 1755]|nr:hypothetical protein HMPREF1548_01999 [Clostridium sp. KLE 1755]